MSQDTEPVELAQALDRATTRRSNGAAGAVAAGPTVEVDRNEPFVLPEIVPATPDDPNAPPTRDREVVPVLPATPEFPTVPVDEPGLPATEAAWPDVAASPVVTGAAGYVAAQPVAVRAPGRRPRVRKVTRTLRHIDPWSTFKVALIFSAVLYGVLLTAGVLLWNVARETGTVDNVERWFTQFGWETFELDGGEIFSQAWVAGLFAAIGLTGFAVLAVTLFNLVSDIIGGVRMTVLEEEVVERRPVMIRRPTMPGRIVTDEQAGAFDLDGDLDDELDSTPRADAVSDTEAGAAVEESRT